MTLVFLGPTSPAQQELFEQAAGTVRSGAFEFGLDITGYFKKARVSWLGCQHPPEPLLELQRTLENALRAACPRHPAFIGRDGTYRPHLTLYRNIRQKPGVARFDPIHWPVSEFCLIESRPSERPVYRILNRWSLRSVERF